MSARATTGTSTSWGRTSAVRRRGRLTSSRPELRRGSCISSCRHSSAPPELTAADLSPMTSSPEPRPRLSRRDFFRLAGAAFGGLAFGTRPTFVQQQFPQADLLGRITVGKMDVFPRPDGSTPAVGALYEDNILPWLREVVGTMPGRINQRFVETPYGFVWGGYIQPVRNQPNVPVAALPQTSLGSGMWVEVTVPYVDLTLDNPPARAPWLQYVSSINLPARFYYSQVVWVDQIRVDASGQVWYRLNEKYGSGDIFWGQAEAF